MNSMKGNLMKKGLFWAMIALAMMHLPFGVLPGAATAEGRAPLEAPASLKDISVTLLKNRDYFQALSAKIHEARKEVVMAFFLFKTNGRSQSYPEIILRELGEAVRRGVRVVVVLEQDEKPGSTVNRDNRDAAERLKKVGVEMHFDSPKKTTHTKLAVIDRRYTFVGSHNLTQSALKYNNELSVLVDSPALAEKTLNYIKSLY
jgi:phosphatidylserine/phosphatidylglycerophosphate/cardiolipin synthase-like enzyme